MSDRGPAGIENRVVQVIPNLRAFARSLARRRATRDRLSGAGHRAPGAGRRAAQKNRAGQRLSGGGSVDALGPVDSGGRKKRSPGAVLAWGRRPGGSSDHTMA